MNAAIAWIAPRFLFPALVGLTALGLPSGTSAQTVEERARIERQLRELEERLARARDAREESLLRLQEHRVGREAESLRAQEQALDRLREELRLREERLQEVREPRLAELRESELRARELAEGRLQELRERTDELRARQEERLRDLQQVVVRTRARVRLGVSFSAQQPEAVNRQGARIETVMEGSPAEEAGLQEGDVITHLNGRSLLTPLPDEGERDFADDESLPVQRLIALARELEAGDEVEIRYLRDGEEESVRFDAADMEEPIVTFFQRSEEGSPLVLHFDPEDRTRWEFTLPDSGFFRFRTPEGGEWEGLDMPALRRWEGGDSAFRGFFLRGPEGRGGVWTMAMGWDTHGLRLTELNPGLGEYFSTSEGVLVLEVRDDSELGLAAGDVIQAIDGRSVEDAADVRRILGSYEEGEAVAFTVVRKGRELKVEGRMR